MKVTYWYAQRETDSDAYSVRERTKKEALARLDEVCGGDPEYRKHHYGPLVKVEVEYDSGLDLLQQCLSEGGLWQEAQASLDAEGNNDG